MRLQLMLQVLAMPTFTIEGSTHERNLEQRQTDNLSSCSKLVGCADDASCY